MTIQELYNTIGNNKDGRINLQNAIKVFEANEDFILNTDIYSNEENYLFTTLFLSQYGQALHNKDRYSKALPFLNRAISLWEHSPDFEDIELRNNWYRGLRFNRGVANYRKKNYVKAKDDFIWLANQDPENELYRNWLISAKNERIGSLANWVMYIGLIALGTEMLLPKKEHAIKAPILIFIGVAYIACAILKILQWYRNRQMKAKNS